MASDGASLRLGVVGFGRVVRAYYVPALRRLDRVRVVAVADPLAASRTAARRAFPDAATYEAVADLLVEAAPDAVLIASPPSTHLAAWTAARAAGVPVFMEKPFVVRGEVDRLAPARGDRLMMNFNRRFWPTFQRIGAMVRSGTLGIITAGEYVLHVDVRPWCAVTRHRLDPREGGVLYDLGSQALDLAHALVGERPVRIAAECSDGRWHGDRARLTLQFAGGSDFHCDLAYAPGTRERLILRGTRGTLRLEDPNMRLHRERAVAPTHPDRTPRDPAAAAGARAPRAGAASSPLARAADLVALGWRGLWRDHSMARASIRAALGAFARAVRGAGPFTPGLDDALTNARWLEAAADAAETGVPVALDGVDPSGS